LVAQRLVASSILAPQYLSIRGTGGGVRGDAVEGGSNAAHEMPVKQLIPVGHPAPLGQLVASEQLDMASS